MSDFVEIADRLLNVAEKSGYTPTFFYWDDDRVGPPPVDGVSFLNMILAARFLYKEIEIRTDNHPTYGGLYLACTTTEGKKRILYVQDK